MSNGINGGSTCSNTKIREGGGDGAHYLMYKDEIMSKDSFYIT